LRDELSRIALLYELSRGRSVCSSRSILVIVCGSPE
jgi:hypothetical protein